MRRGCAAWTCGRCATGCIAAAPRGSPGCRTGGRAGAHGAPESRARGGGGRAVRTSPDLATHAVVRSRRVDLARVLVQRFGIGPDERRVGKSLRPLGFRHLSVRPRHPGLDAETQAAHREPCGPGHRGHPAARARPADRTLVAGRRPCRPARHAAPPAGGARIAPAHTARPALLLGLSVRCRVSCPRCWLDTGAAARRQRSDEPVARRDQRLRRARRPCRADPAPRRLAPDRRQAAGAQHHQPAASAALRAELNPVETLWQFLRQKQRGDQVFDIYRAIVDTCCDARNCLTAEPGRITSIAIRESAQVGIQSRRHKTARNFVSGICLAAAITWWIARVHTIDSGRAHPREQGHWLRDGSPKWCRLSRKDAAHSVSFRSRKVTSVNVVENAAGLEVATAQAALGGSCRVSLVGGGSSISPMASTPM